MNTPARVALIALSMVFVLLMAALSVVNVVQARRLGEATAAVAVLRSELDDARAQTQQLRDQLAAADQEPAVDGQGEAEPDDGSSDAGPAADELSGLLDGLLGGDSGIGELFEGLLGGEFEDLAALQTCMTPPEVDGPAIPETGLDAQTAAIAEWVEELRDLSFEDVPAPEPLSNDEIADRLAAMITQDYPEDVAEADSEMLAMLGAVPDGTDLQALQIDLLGVQVAGFYLPDTDELIVRSEGTGAALGPAEQVTLAHELQHALTDQVHGLSTDLISSVEDPDAALAAISVYEGDAVVTQQHFLTSAFDLGEQLAMAMNPAALDSFGQLEAYPHYVRESLIFPYEHGPHLVCANYADDGWDGVDQLYGELPTTTAQILWPERYPEGEDAAVTAELRAPDGWNEEPVVRTFGAAELLWLLEAPGDDVSAALSDPLERAAAWAGGRQFLFTDGDESAGGLALVQRAGEADLCRTAQEWYRAAFPGSQDAGARPGEALAVAGSGQAGVVVCSGDDVLVAIADDVATARELLP